MTGEIARKLNVNPEDVENILNSTKMTRGLRNNNPRNIARIEPIGRERWNLPATLRFAVESMAWGYRAMFKCLNTYSRKYGLDTIA